MINARAETLAEKRSFNEPFEQRRCLVLVDGLYEWQQRRAEKQPYRIARIDGKPFALAGLWETWQNGETLTTTTIVTTEPNGLMEPIHDRMPVILPKGREREWIETDDVDDLETLLRPYPTDDFTAYPISKRVNNPANDDPSIIDEVDDSGGQAGLGEFL